MRSVRREDASSNYIRLRRTIRQEVSILLPLRHPNIVALLGHCLNPFCMVLEYAPQGALDRVLFNYKRAGMRLDAYVVQECIVQVCLGLVIKTLPSFPPSLLPSLPSFLPSFLLSFLPSFRPSFLPPSLLPSFPPSLLPSFLPSFPPSLFPSFLPSFPPSFIFYFYFFLFLFLFLSFFLFSFKKVNIVLYLCSQCSSALKYLHKHHIIYRDLKSENVLVWSFPAPFSADQSGHEVLIKLADYGISRSAALAGMKGLGGTPGFMAPEIEKYVGKEVYTDKVCTVPFKTVTLLGGKKMNKFDINVSCKPSYQRFRYIFFSFSSTQYSAFYLVYLVRLTEKGRGSRNNCVRAHTHTHTHTHGERVTPQRDRPEN